MGQDDRRARVSPASRREEKEKKSLTHLDATHRRKLNRHQVATCASEQCTLHKFGQASAGMRRRRQDQTDFDAPPGEG